MSARNGRSASALGMLLRSRGDSERESGCVVASFFDRSGRSFLNSSSKLAMPSARVEALSGSWHRTPELKAHLWQLSARAPANSRMVCAVVAV